MLKSLKYHLKLFNILKRLKFGNCILFIYVVPIDVYGAPVTHYSNSNLKLKKKTILAKSDEMDD